MGKSIHKSLGDFGNAPSQASGKELWAQPLKKIPAELLQLPYLPFRKVR
jgi:hypothetical protein